MRLSAALGSGPLQDRDRPPRRQKVNKYKKKSESNDKDPLELLIEESKTKLEEINKARNPKGRNTRIATEELEELKSAPRQFVFPDNKDIDPSDPTSFGFIEIGTVVGPHGVYGEIKVKSSSGFSQR
jgi:hypothetical protein